MKKCSRCGKEYDLSKQDSILRKLVGANAKLFPALEAIANASTDYCNECWKESVGGSAKQLLKEPESESATK